MSTFQVDYNAGSYDGTYPLFLQDKNISPEEYQQTINYISQRTAEIEKNSMNGMFIPVWIGINGLATIILGGVLALNALYLRGELSTIFWIAAPITYVFVTSVLFIVLLYRNIRIRNKKIQAYAVLKNDIERESSKYHSRGVQILLRFKDVIVHGHKRSHTVQIPYLELILYNGQQQPQSYQQSSQYQQPQQYIQYQQPQQYTDQIPTNNQIYSQPQQDTTVYYPTESNYQNQQSNENVQYQSLNSPTFYQK
eukprot:gene3960-7216_t